METIGSWGVQSFKSKWVIKNRRIVTYGDEKSFQLCNEKIRGAATGYDHFFCLRVEVSRLAKVDD